jgi:inner membrane protein
MTGKTHLAVGEAAALLLTHPTSPRTLALCVGTAAIGSLICDIDVTTSHSHRDQVKISSVAVLATAVTAVLELHFQLGILAMLQRQTNLMRILLGLAVILMVCNFGMRQPHRSFMHSILGWGILTGLVWEIFPFLAPVFAVSMASHILLDLLNRKKVRLLYPFGKGVCFRLCPADGAVNDLLWLIGTIAFFASFALCLWNIFL